MASATGSGMSTATEPSFSRVLRAKYEQMWGWDRNYFEMLVKGGIKEATEGYLRYLGDGNDAVPRAEEVGQELQNISARIIQRYFIYKIDLCVSAKVV